jgi:DNA-binding MarR family transcriptional regulator
MITTKTKTTMTTKTIVESSFSILSQVVDLWQDELKTELRQYNLSYIEFTLLSGLLWLSEKEAEVTQVNICTYTSIKAMNASIVMRGLQAKGFVKRQEHSVDTRAKTIKFTEKGLEIMETVIAKVEELNISFFNTSTAEFLKITKALETIRNSRKERLV